MKLLQLITQLEQLPQPVKLDFTPIVDVAKRGLARGYIFSLYTLRARSKLSFDDFSDGKGISSQSGFFTFHLYNIDDDNGFKMVSDEFEGWVVRNSFCEAIHSYCLFLDNLFSHLLLFEKFTKHTSLRVLTAKESAFYRETSLFEKLKALQDRFKISSMAIDYAKALTVARNLFTHNHGFVRDEDQNSPEGFKIGWRYIQMLAINSDGKESIIENITKVQGEAIGYKWVEYWVTTKVDKKINLHPSDLCQIFAFLQGDLGNLEKSLNTFLGVDGEKQRQVGTMASRLRK